MLASATLTLLLLIPTAPGVEADVVIRGATLYDGSGQPGRKGDLAIRGDRIVAVGSFTVAGKPRVLDGTGLIVAPGFIDLHTHSDTALTQPATTSEPLLPAPGRHHRGHRQLRRGAGRRGGVLPDTGERAASAATSSTRCRTTTCAEGHGQRQPRPDGRGAAGRWKTSSIRA